jgi:hypothetical protein
MKQSKIVLFLLSVSMFSLVSCLKESRMNIDADRSIDIVEFANTESNRAGATSVYPGFYKDLGVLNTGESATFNVNVSYSGASEAPEDITVEIGLDTAALSLYNSQNGTSYVAPPSDVAAVPGSVVIKKGSRIAQTQITINNTSNFDYNVAYALPLKISSATKGTISSNFGKAIYSFGVRNAYDGHYSMKGYSLRGGDPVKTGNFSNPDGLNLVTVGKNIVQFEDLQVWADLTGVGVGNPVITVNADNTLTLSSEGGIYNAPGYNSRYEPDTKTFYLSFSWGAGPAARLATDTLTYVEPR